MAKLFEQGNGKCVFFFSLLITHFFHSAFAEVFCLETVGLQKILSLLEAEDADVRIHAVKVVANLAAEGVSGCFLSVLVH